MLEVQLVNDVRNCKTCQWFWGGTPPYGNFPVYDWKNDYPEEVQNQVQTTESITKKAMMGSICEQGQVTPGIMHGCRKAPIMTVGINPNMTSYFPGTSGTRWSYPNFSKPERYAYYYRYHNVYQESLDIDLIKKHVAGGTQLIAKKDGWLRSAKRSLNHRWMLLTIEYIDQKIQEIEIAWTDDLRFVLFVDIRRSTNKDDLSFKQGDLIGGKISNLEIQDAQIYENTTGYYQRYVHVLEKFKKMMGDHPLGDAPLSISEDVAQHDMIACASPGWSSMYDIPTGKITKNCVIDKAFVVSQLIQTKPAVIVIVGGSTLEMFVKVFAPHLKNFTYEYEEPDQHGKMRKVIKETFQLLKETTERKKYLHITEGDYELKARIVVSPHFSYNANFAKHSRLSQKAWQAFNIDFHEDAKILKNENRIQENTWNDFVPINFAGKDDPIKEKLSAASLNVLMAYYYDPLKMLAQVLKQEQTSGRLKYDEKTGRLSRLTGGCRFCKNDKWQFPDGCLYGKDKEEPSDQKELEKIVQQIIAASQDEEK